MLKRVWNRKKKLPKMIIYNNNNNNIINYSRLYITEVIIILYIKMTYVIKLNKNKNNEIKIKYLNYYYD